MKKIRITEKQANLLGLNKIKENEDGVKSSGTAMGELVVRVVVSGSELPKFKDRAIALILRQDPQADVKFFEATGKIVGNIKDSKRKQIERDLKALDQSMTIEKKAPLALKENVRNLVKITKEQYDRIFGSNSLNEGINRVNANFKKEFTGKNIQTMKEPTGSQVSEDDTIGTKFDINKRNTSVPKLPASVGHRGVSESEEKVSDKETEGEDQFHNECVELIKYLYRKNESLSTFWEQQGLPYDKICQHLLAKNFIVSKNGKYELSKKLGTNPQEALATFENELRKIAKPQAVPVEAEIDEDNYPAGVEHDSNAAWNQKEPDTTRSNQPKVPQLVVVAINNEIAIFKGSDGALYVFYYDNIDKKDFMEYASVPRTYVGKDEDGQPEYDYDFDNVEIDGDVIGHYVNDNLAQLSKAEGVEAYETGQYDLVKIDEPLKQELASLYDKDRNFAKLFGTIEEADFEGVMGRFKDDLKQAHTAKPVSDETPEARQSRIVTKLQQLKDKEKQRQSGEEAEIAARRASAEEVDEMTATGSAGAFTPPMSGGDIVKREIPATPVVAEVSTVASTGNFQYDAPGLANVGRNGEFKDGAKPKAFKTTQWAGGEMVEQPKCSKLNNNKSAENGGCNQGASSLKTNKTGGSINAPSLGENEIYEAIAAKTGKSLDEVKKIILSKKNKA